jgi:hypothetical protein
MRQLGAIPDACSPHQGSELALDGFATLAELPGDLLVGPTLDQQTGNGSLRRRQHKRWASGARPPDAGNIVFILGSLKFARAL